MSIKKEVILNYPHNGELFEAVVKGVDSDGNELPYSHLIPEVSSLRAHNGGNIYRCADDGSEEFVGTIEPGQQVSFQEDCTIIEVVHPDKIIRRGKPK